MTPRGKGCDTNEQEIQPRSTALHWKLWGRQCRAGDRTARPWGPEWEWGRWPQGGVPRGPPPHTEQTRRAAPPPSPSPSQSRFPCSLGPWRRSWALGDQQWPCLQGLPVQGSRGRVDKHRCLQHAAQPGRLHGGSDGRPTCLRQQTAGVGWEKEGEEPAHAPGCMRPAGALASPSRRLTAAPPASGCVGCVGRPQDRGGHYYMTVIVPLGPFLLPVT